MKKVTFDKFSIKRYDDLVNKDAKFKLIDDKGREYRIISRSCGINHDELMVECNYNSYSGDVRTASYYVSKTGKFQDGSHLYIWQGCTDVKKGDLIRYTFGHPDGSFYFYYLFDSVCKMNNAMGFGLYWGMDMNGDQFDLCHTFHDYEKERPFYAEPAHEGDWDKYEDFVLKNGYEFDEHGVHDLPKVGEDYFEIIIRDGKLEVVNRFGPASEEYRPLGNPLCFRYKERAEAVRNRMEEASFKKNL